MGKLNSITAILLALVYCSCVEREGAMGSRNNPCDPGGENWTVNAPSEVAVRADTLWADFDHADSTGSILLAVSINDRNFPFDTVSAEVVYNGQRFRLPPSASRLDTALWITGIRFTNSKSCSLVARDTRGAAVTAVCIVLPNGAFPPLAPDPVMSMGTSVGVRIDWQPVPDAVGYLVLFSDTKGGPFILKYTVPQPASGTVTVIDTPAALRYYLLVSYNSAGSSISQDTLLGQVYFEGVPRLISSNVSRGQFQDRICLSFSFDKYSPIDHVEILRSIRDTSSFRQIKTILWQSGMVSGNWCDSIVTGDTCYYRVMVVDNFGRCGRPEPVGSGFLQQLAAPAAVTVSANDEYLRVAWTPVPSAAYYRLYRSAAGCAQDMQFHDTVYECTYSDTPPTTATYYYTVRSVDVSGREGYQGNGCASAKVRILSAPGGFSVSDGTYLHRIELSWQPVTGAAGYVIRRGPADRTMQDTIIDTVTATYCNDTVEDTGSFYYCVAAFNERGRGEFSDSKKGRICTPPTPRVVEFDGFVQLNWSALGGVRTYYLYRSDDSVTFFRIDSTTNVYYNDSISDFKRHYYRLAVLASDGMSEQGAATGGQRRLFSPIGLTVTTSGNAIRISWDPVQGAQKYVVYRSLFAGSFTQYRTLTETACLDSSPSAKSYYYCVSVVVGGTESPQSTPIKGSGIVQSKPPDAPPSIWTNGVPGAISITWTTMSTSAFADGYYIFRRRSTDGDFVCIDTIGYESYYDSVPDTQVYYYKVSAFNNAGISPFSKSVSGIRGVPSVEPSSPKLVSVTGRSACIEVSWGLSVSGFVIDGYYLYRGNSSSGTFACVETLSVQTCCDTVPDASVYFYKVSAFNAAGVSSFSSIGSGKRTSP